MLRCVLIGFLAAALTAVLLLPSEARAARFSGVYLIELCGMDEKGHEKVKGGHTACQAYIAGVVDYHNVLQSMGIAPSVDICIPEKTTSAELHVQVLRYLEKNMQHDSFVAAPAVTMALYDAFPCKKKK